MLSNEALKFGHRRYRSIDGVRHLVGLRPTIRPYLTESNEDFQRRMGRLEEILRGDSGVREVEVDFKWNDEAIVECLIDVVLVPVLAPIEADARPAGARTEQRGARGRGTGVKLCPA